MIFHNLVSGIGTICHGIILVDPIGFPSLSQLSVSSWQYSLNGNRMEICHWILAMPLGKVFCNWMVLLVLILRINCCPPFLNSVPEPSLGLANVQEIRAFPTEELVNDILSVTIDRGCYFPRFFGSIALV